LDWGDVVDGVDDVAVVVDGVDTPLGAAAAPAIPAAAPAVARAPTTKPTRINRELFTDVPPIRRLGDCTRAMLEDFPKRTRTPA
jgi:hypothetical protein